MVPDVQTQFPIHGIQFSRLFTLLQQGPVVRSGKYDTVACIACAHRNDAHLPGIIAALGYVRLAQRSGRTQNTDSEGSVDDGLLRKVLERLDAASSQNHDPAVDEEAAHLVLAALLDEVDTALDAEVPRPTTEPPAPSASPLRAYVDSIRVEGFRGVGPGAELDLPPGPGLTVVVGRNGTGKSSFAEALEFALTGDNRRWSSRDKQWRDGWRNLHHDGDASIEASLRIDGEPGTAKVCSVWPSESTLDESDAFVHRNGEREPVSSLGWASALATYRPFLSYSELGAMLDGGPAKLFDALAAILGLEDLTVASKRLADTCKGITKRQKEVERQRKELVDLLEELRDRGDECDDRVVTCHGALSTRTPDLNSVAEVLAKDATVRPDDVGVRTLRKVVGLQAPDPERAAALAEELKAAAQAAVAAEGTNAGRALQVAEILERAIELHRQHGDVDCPVCSTPEQLGEAWAAEAENQSARLKAEAGAASAVRSKLDAAEHSARGFIGSQPSALVEADTVGLDSQDLREAWHDLADLRKADRETLQGRLADCVATVAAATASLREAAAAELQRRQDTWLPVADRLRTWLPEAQRSERHAALVQQLKGAEKWIKDTEAAIRDERFAPIAEKVKDYWQRLRMNSSVELEDVFLAGVATRRHVELQVSVDGTDGVALGVMSQGELHALALALFLPRATLDESPFGFVVIDDPVQAMDPARVDGLAGVLHEVARDRQVVVFTHDDRLPDAVRRMRIPARVVEVQRRSRSFVEVRRRKGPVEDAIDDAMALVHTEGFPRDALVRVVPGLCRQALEAACIDVVRRRRLERGEPHAEIEQLLVDHPRLLERLALALQDDASEAPQITQRIRNKYGPWAADVVHTCNRGAHGDTGTTPLNLVRGAEDLAGKLAEIAK